MLDLTWLDFFILILASYRLTHLIVFDEITSFIRDPFLTVTYQPLEDGQLLRNTEIKGTGYRYWIGKFLSCYWCVGVWSSLGVVLLFWLMPISFPILLFLAVAGGAAIIENKV